MSRTIRKILKWGSASAVVALGFNTIWNSQKERAALKQALFNNASKDMLEIKGPEAVTFPWHEPADQLAEPESWEYRRVKMRGRLSKTSHLVFCVRDGEPGYLVFKLLLTARFFGGDKPLVANPSIIPASSGVMVNVGWVPRSKIVSLGFDDIPLFKKPKVNEDKPYLFPQVHDPFTGVVHNAVTEDEVEFPKEGYNTEEVIVTGYLKKLKPLSLLNGNYNWSPLVTSAIDLDRMIAFYGLTNTSEAREYYVEAAVPKDLSKVKENSLVIPASFFNTKQDIERYVGNPSIAYTLATMLPYLSLPLVLACLN